MHRWNHGQLVHNCLGLCLAWVKGTCLAARPNLNIDMFPVADLPLPGMGWWVGREKFNRELKKKFKKKIERGHFRQVKQQQQTDIFLRVAQ